MDEATYQKFRRRLMDAHMKVELLKARQDKPYYAEEYAKAKEELDEIRHELAHFKMMALEEQLQQEKGGR